MLKVDTVFLENQAGQMQTLAEKLEQISQEVASANQRLQWDVSISSRVRRELGQYNDYTSQLSQRTANLSAALRSAAEQYAATEQKITAGSAVDGTGSGVENGSSKEADDALTDKEIRKRSKEVTKKAAIGMVVDIVMVGVTILKMPKELSTKGPVAYANTTKKLIDLVFATGSDLIALAEIPIAYGVSEVMGANEESRRRILTSAVEEAEKNESVDGLTDVLENNGYGELAEVSKAIDVASDAYSLADGFNDAKETLYSNVEDIDVVGELGFTSSEDIAEKMAEKGLDSGFVSYVSETGSKASNIETIVGYLQSLYDGRQEGGISGGIFSGIQEVLENTSVGGEAKDLLDLLDDLVVEVH